MRPQHEDMDDAQIVFNANNGGSFVESLMRLANGSSEKSTPVSDNESSDIEGADVRKSLLNHLATKAVNNVRREKGF